MGTNMISTRHLVKGEDLNHHGTLYAGRGVEWMVEAGFMTASAATESENIVCMRINSLLFIKPVPQGQMVSYDSRICFAGRTSLTAYVRVSNSRTGEFIVDGFFTYVYTDDNGKPKPHGIVITPKTEIEKELYDEAEELLEESKRDAEKQRKRRE
ncbi:MAG: hotdog domain-containing protein [Eubacteriaceae bacterium]|nr:hotdog domain-containing protein [Eubacteriaceae bacterium]